MKIIVISSPDFFPDEGNAINQLFENGMENLHLRKPGCSREDLQKVLESIAAAYYSKIALHQHHDLAAEFGIKGLHFPETHRNTTSEQLFQDLIKEGYRLSTSIHNEEELKSLSDAFSYTFFGPVFDSISKAGYKGIAESGFYLNKQSSKIQVIALGGIDASNIQKIKDMNFDGAALLGAIWQKQQPLSLLSVGLSRRQWTGELRSFELGAVGLRPPQEILDELAQMQEPNLAPANSFAKGQPPKSITVGFSRRLTEQGKLQFISNESPEYDHLESISLALQAGCRWIQLRVKDQPENRVLELAREAKSCCDSYGAKLIINDFPVVARMVNADGLHLGLDDMPVREAREIVGDEMIIGGTANTLEHVIQRIQEGADYVGLGPFRFTTTKQNLSPILGLEGYRAILTELKERQLSIPIIAIGGIQQEDIAALKAAGLYGVAMSSALLHSRDIRKTVLEIQKSLC